MESGYKGLCFSGGAHRSLGLDCDDWSVGRGCFGNSGVLLGTKVGDMSPLVALEAESILDSLPLFFVSECSSCPCSSYVHCVRVAVGEGVSPLWLCCSSSLVVSPDSFFEEDVF